MASKKRAAARPAAKPKAVQTPTPNPMWEVPSAGNAETVAPRSVWTLPIAMLMLVVAAGGLWLAVRESSNAPQAATPAATRDVMRPETPVSETKASPAGVPARTADDAATASHVDAVKAASITGCLQASDNGFVLKNAEGSDAPKSRSWKSGFFKRSSAAIDLHDASSSTHLSSHVGQRVSVTGPLADRRMEVQSLRRVAASCQ